MQILSLFDGISAAQVAFSRLNIPYTYYASEIDKEAISVTQANFPNTIQLGNVNNINFSNFIGKIDVLIGGSPCQNLSIAGNGKGLKGNQSVLFFKFLEALQTVKPKYFIFENVASMRQQDCDAISKFLGVIPISINSELVSAQRRPRLYWCNFLVKGINNKNLFIKDILDNNAPNNLYLPESLDLIYQLVPAGGCWRHLPDENEAKKRIVAARNDYEKRTGKSAGGQTGFWRHFGLNEKCPCLTASGIKQSMTRIVWKDPNTNKFRYPSPLECERLQTFPDNYTQIINKTNKRYELLGNSFTVDVIEHIFRNMLTNK